MNSLKHNSRARLRINRDFVQNRGTINRVQICRDFESWTH